MWYIHVVCIKKFTYLKKKRKTALFHSALESAGSQLLSSTRFSLSGNTLRREPTSLMELDRLNIFRHLKQQQEDKMIANR